LKHIAIGIMVVGVLAAALGCRSKDASNPPAGRAALKPAPSAPAGIANQSPAQTQRSGRPQERDTDLLHTMR
jgi:hypothetical protein